MDMVRRDQCVFSGAKDLETLHVLKQFPVFMGCADHGPEDDLFADMNWCISKTTGSIQLNPLIPLEVLYREQHVDSIGETLIKHHQQFAEFVSRYKVRNVFEIGGAHGKLACNYQRLNPGASWTILEKNPRLVEGAKVKVIAKFFDESFNEKWAYDAVVHSHVFEHIYSPAGFMKKLGEFVPPGKHQFLAIPNMIPQLKNFFLSTIDFEHTLFLSEPFVEYLLAENGFEILEKKYYLEDHSIWFATRKNPATPKLPLPACYKENKALFNNYINHYLSIIGDLNQKVETADKPVYLFGAHIFSQYLRAFGLKTGRIVSILDNGPSKIGRRLYGTQMKVESPKILKGKGPVYVILKAGMYNAEIKKDILENINSEVIFWE